MGEGELTIISKLWYKKPAEIWEEALPLGNGRLGAMVFGSIEREHIQLNEDSIWYGRHIDRNNPDALKNVPCYCGCGKVGHTSNYSCYVKDVKPSGEIVFDQHALGCGICVDIAQNVMKMTRDGKSPKEIRTAIDTTFAQYGPSNMAPVQ